MADSGGWARYGWQAGVLVCLSPPILNLDVPVPGIYKPSADESPFEGGGGK